MCCSGIQQCPNPVDGDVFESACACAAPASVGDVLWPAALVQPRVHLPFGSCVECCRQYEGRDAAEKVERTLRATVSTESQVYFNRSSEESKRWLSVCSSKKL